MNKRSRWSANGLLTVFGSPLAQQNLPPYRLNLKTSKGDWWIRESARADIASAGDRERADRALSRLREVYPHGHVKLEIHQSAWIDALGERGIGLVAVTVYLGGNRVWVGSGATMDEAVSDAIGKARDRLEPKGTKA